MLAIPRAVFADCSVANSAQDWLYTLKPKGPKAVLQSYSLRTKKQTGIAVLGRRCSALVVLERAIAVIGGCDEQESAVYGDCDSVDIATGAVARMAELNVPRAKAAGVSHSSGLYVMGGFGCVKEAQCVKYRLLATVEKLTSGNWAILSLLLPIPLSLPSVVQTGDNLYLVGKDHIGGKTSGSVISKAVFEVSFPQWRIAKIAELRYSAEVSFPLLAEESSRRLRLRYLRNADTRTGELDIEWTDWQLRKTLLLARLRLQRLTLI